MTVKFPDMRIQRQVIRLIRLVLNKDDNIDQSEPPKFIFFLNSRINTQKKYK